MGMDPHWSMTVHTPLFQLELCTVGLFWNPGFTLNKRQLLLTHWLFEWRIHTGELGAAPIVSLFLAFSVTLFALFNLIREILYTVSSCILKLYWTVWNGGMANNGLLSRQHALFRSNKHDSRLESL